MTSVAGNHAKCVMVKPRDFSPSLKMVCIPVPPAPSSVKLFAPCSAVGIQEGTAAPKGGPKVWVGKETFKCALPPFLLFCLV